MKSSYDIANRQGGYNTVMHGIYIHIPFCRTKCSYCHFVSVPITRAAEERYLKAVLRELEVWSDAGSEQPAVDSIYFGGGTPSLIPAGHISEMLALCRLRFQVGGDCEISLESNPGTLSPGKIDTYRSAGINRVSLGVQSFNNEELKGIGRMHNAEMVLDAIRVLRNGGFTDINLDLMLGLPGQSAESWRRSLQSAVCQEVPHLSVYMLDLDDECPMKALFDSGSVRLPEEDLISDLYLETIEFLASQGYAQYEISNFARPGSVCRHNMKYWNRQPVYGFGAASHSFDGDSRYCNDPRLEKYIESVLAGDSPVSWREKVSAGQSLSESLFLGLRLRQGVDWKGLEAEYNQGCLLPFEPGMQDLAERGLIEWNGSIVRLTESGMLLSNEIFQLFI